MPKFVSPTGNLEVWDEMPAGYSLPQECEVSEVHSGSESESALPQCAEPALQLNVMDVIQNRLDEIEKKLAVNDQTFVQLYRVKTAGTATDAENTQLTALEAENKKLRAEKVTLEMQLAVLQTMKHSSGVEESSTEEVAQGQVEQELLSVEDIQKRIAVLQQEVAEIDAAVVQPMRASFSGTATAEEQALLADLEVKSEALRVELAGYESKLAVTQDS